jgi:ubiquinol-cytochrome c reductase cytochrome b subunit
MLERRKPKEPVETFWPAHIFKEAVVTLIVFIALVLIVIFLPPAHESVARPMDTSYIPRPEWYFLFLFKLLEFFPGKLEVVGAILVPALAVLVLLLLPFFDRSPTMKPLQRPLASGVGLFVITAIIFLTIQGIAAAPPSMTSRTAYIELGEKLYREQDCTTCHAINGVGGTIGPDLAGLTERRTLSWIHQYLEDPLMTNPNSAMPGYLGALTHEEIESISLYLTTLEKTSAEVTQAPEVAPAPPAPATPPPVPHSLEGRSTCLACHETGIGGAPRVPSDHSGRGNDVCLSCHQTE